MCVGTVIAKHAYAQSSLKGEDVMLVPSSPVNCCYVGNCLLYAICDGHATDRASYFIGKNLERVFEQNIDYAALEIAQEKGIEEVASVFRGCMHSTFTQLDQEFLTKFDSTAGSTLTVVAVYGRLVTIGNVGDSRVMVVTSHGAAELTEDHRIQENAEERQRLIDGGANIGRGRINNRPAGILRIWPGGLALSRSIGDDLSKPHVVSDPLLTQLIIPENEKIKLVAASDGLWDELQSQEVAYYASYKKLYSLPQKLIKKAVQYNDGELMDDTSVLAISLKCLSLQRHSSIGKSGKLHLDTLFSCNGQVDFEEQSARDAFNKAVVPNGFFMLNDDIHIPIFRTDTLQDKQPKLRSSLEGLTLSTIATLLDQGCIDSDGRCVSEQLTDVSYLTSSGELPVPSSSFPEIKYPISNDSDDSDEFQVGREVISIAPTTFVKKSPR
eukprot:TRINITY_DN5548_c0_g2_i1.p1 TRINITY_DN5548_c0_g2~~TRINITY_DN5548_c0_g2_i1.p1  ORF type:complete len:440 (+),score=53.67 TRINITY_DN5548_c0_g2_i1:420-1739(+)